MQLKLIASLTILTLGLGIGCTTPPAPRVLTISEQIQVDTQKAKDFFNDFQKKVAFVSYPEAERYLNLMAERLAKVETGFDFESVKVRIHDDTNPNLTRLFSFPGTTISMPVSLLKKVEYENELAAIFAFELANVINRHLAKKMDQTVNPALFGKGSVFEMERSERLESIKLGTRLLYFAGYDTRGMASIFSRYPQDFSNGSSELNKKEVEFNVREAQKAKSEYLPSRDPIVRSAEFIKMKKGLKRL